MTPTRLAPLCLLPLLPLLPLLASCTAGTDGAAPARSAPAPTLAASPVSTGTPAVDVTDVPGSVTGSAQVAGNDVTYRVRPVVRTAGRAVATVDVTLVGASTGSSAPVGVYFKDPFREGSHQSFSLVRLVDLPGRHVYLAARGSSGVAATSVTRGVDVGTSFSGQVAFAGVPSDVARIGVLVEGLGYAQVPVVDSGIPSVNSTAADLADHNPYAKRQLTPADLSAAADAPVLPLEAYVEQPGLRARSTRDALRLSLDTAVLFRLDSAVLTPQATAALVEAATQVRARAAGGRVDVTGYTDDSGSDAHNLVLSRARAAAVRQALTPRLPGFTLVASGRGEQDPAVPGTGEAARRLNRRVELTLTAPARPAPAASTGDGSTVPIRPGTPTARGREAVRVTSTYPKGLPLLVSAPSVVRTDGALLVTLHVANADSTRLGRVLGLLASGALNARGEFSPREQASANALQVLVGRKAVHPLDYRNPPPGDQDLRTTLTDQYLSYPLPPGRGVQTVTALFPDVGGPTVTLDVPGVLRLQDVPVT